MRRSPTPFGYVEAMIDVFRPGLFCRYSSDSSPSPDAFPLFVSFQINAVSTMVLTRDIRDQFVTSKPSVGLFSFPAEEAFFFPFPDVVISPWRTLLLVPFLLVRNFWKIPFRPQKEVLLTPAAESPKYRRLLPPFALLRTQRQAIFRQPLPPFFGVFPKKIVGGTLFFTVYVCYTKSLIPPISISFVRPTQQRAPPAYSPLSPVDSVESFRQNSAQIQQCPSSLVVIILRALAI